LQSLPAAFDVEASADHDDDHGAVPHDDHQPSIGIHVMFNACIVFAFAVGRAAEASNTSERNS
jgi:hypothetical protein